MAYSERDLRAAAAAGMIGPAELGRLLQFLAARQPEPSGDSVLRAKFDAVHLLWYAGALIVIGAMGLFSTLAFSRMGGLALTTTAVVYAIAFTWAGHHLWYRKNLPSLGGLLITIAVSMAPLAVYGLQTQYGWFGDPGDPGAMRNFYIWVKGSWILMEIAAVVAGVVALYFYPFPLIVFAIAVALWFMSMDLALWIFGTPDVDFDMRRKVSVWFGLGVIAVAWVVDYNKQSRDFAFWLHLLGLMAFWGAISVTDSSSEAVKALYCLLNVSLLLLSTILVRRTYAVFGALGISIYLGHLAGVVFADSLLFPFALSLIGIGVIACGLVYHRRQRAISAWLNAHMPNAVMRLRPTHTR